MSIERLRAKSYAPGQFGAGAARAGSGGDAPGTTTHVSVIDRRGNAVAITCTIEQEFGSAVMAPGTGFLLNNELTDFGNPGTKNEAAPRKRPRSSMARRWCRGAGSRSSWSAGPAACGSSWARCSRR